MSGRVRSAAAGAIAATVWGALEPVDQRVFRYRYSDVAVLGKLATQGPRWRTAGFAIHAANGAVFGVAYHELRRRRGWSALRLSLAEHLALYPLSALVDRYPPARGSDGIPPLLDARAFAQATVRHALFGTLLGRLASPATARGRTSPPAQPARRSGGPSASSPSAP